MSLDFVIVGSPRSGTTLAQRLASELDGVCVPPETHFFSRLSEYLPSSKPRTFARSEAIELLQRYLRLDTSVDLPVSAAEILDQVVRFPAGLVELYCAVVRSLCPDGVQTLGEKTPHHVRWWRLLTEAIPDLRVVGMVRDPRAVVASNLAVPFGMRHADVLAAMWRDDAIELLRAQTALPDRVIVVRFEDMVHRHEDVQRRLGDLLLVRGGGSIRSGPLFQPREAPWKSTATEAVDVARASAWQGILDESQIEIVDVLCGTVMREFGYEPTSRRLDGLRQLLPGGAGLRLARHRVGVWRRTRFVQKVTRLQT